MDFSQRVVIETYSEDWVASPMAGVWRKPLAREDAERGHATSIVRYEPGAQFRQHDHPLGEENLVLEGTFSDETGDYPAGTYFRNPQGFRHAPFSDEGCLLLVKLHQFQLTDTEHVVIDTSAAAFQAGVGNVKVLPLHRHNKESVRLEQWASGTTMQTHSHSGGEEIYVMSGELRDELGQYSAGCWLRNPHLSEHTAYVDVDTVLWVKAGHLPG